MTRTATTGKHQPQKLLPIYPKRPFEHVRLRRSAATGALRAGVPAPGALGKARAGTAQVPAQELVDDLGPVGAHARGLAPGVFPVGVDDPD